MKPQLCSTSLWVCLIASPLSADPMGATDASILATLRASLAEHTTTAEAAVERLKKAKEGLDISKKLAEWEELKAIKDLAGSGSEMRRLIATLQDGKEGFFRLINYPYKQVNALKTDLVSLQAQAKRAGNDPDLLDRIDRYSAVIARTDNLAIIEDALIHAKRTRLEKGQSEGDAIRESSHNLAIMAELLVGQEKDRMAKEAETLSARERAKLMSFKRGGAFGAYGSEKP